MANETRIADIVEPEVFAPYIMERSLNQNRFFQAGVIQKNPQIPELIKGGGKVFTLPYWKDLTGATDVPSETKETEINGIGADKMVARRQIREKAWGANDLSAAIAGDDPYAAIGDRVSGFWAKADENALIYTLRGVIAGNVKDDESDLVVDISVASGTEITSANKISAKKSIEAIMKMGDAFEEIVAVAVHSVVYQTLVENDLIDFIEDSEGKLTIATYMGLRLIVSDNLPVITGAGVATKYHSYFFKSEAVAYGQYDAGAIIPIEVARKPGIGGGTDILYTRKQYVLHPLGFTWAMTSDIGITPTDANLIDEDSWNRVYDKKNTGVVAVISNG